MAVNGTVLFAADAGSHVVWGIDLASLVAEVVCGTGDATDSLGDEGEPCALIGLSAVEDVFYDKETDSLYVADTGT